MKPLGAAIAVAAILAFAGLFYFNIKQAEDAAARCPGHWHASFLLVVDGKPVSYNHPALFIETGEQYGNSMPLRTHVHQGSPGVMHFEPPGQSTTCIPLRSMMDHLGTEITDEGVELSGPGHDAMSQSGSHAVNATEPLHVYTRLGKAGSWAPYAGSVAGFMGEQRPDGEKILFLLGTYTDAQVQSFQDQVPVPPSANWA